MKRILLLFSGVLICCVSSFATGRQIRGKVINDTGDPIPGVNILLSGTPTGAQTDASGNFVISASGTNNVNLVNSSSGYEYQNISTDGYNLFNFTLVKSVSILDDVVVI
jgi:hypothetical protein